MNRLPYLDPDRELSLNLGILLIILDCLSVTKREKRVLTLDKAQIFMYLASSPVMLNRVLAVAGMNEVAMDENEYYTVSSISSNVDPLFNREKIKHLFKQLTAKSLLEVSYSSKDGFLFELNDAGKEKAQYLTDNYFSSTRKYVKQLGKLQSTSIGMLNSYINMALKTGIVNE